MWTDKKFQLGVIFLLTICACISLYLFFEIRGLKNEATEQIRTEFQKVLPEDAHDLLRRLTLMEKRLESLDALQKDVEGAVKQVDAIYKIHKKIAEPLQEFADFMHEKKIFWAYIAHILKNAGTGSGDKVEWFMCEKCSHAFQYNQKTLNNCPRCNIPSKIMVDFKSVRCHKCNRNFRIIAGARNEKCPVCKIVLETE